MSLALATKGVISDFTGIGGSGPPIYVLENINVEVSHDDLDITVSLLDDVSIDISEVGVSIDLDQDNAEIIVSEDETINVEV
jgi:hypothetical protein